MNEPTERTTGTTPVKDALKINGVITVPKGQRPDDFFDELIDFLESKGASFGGGTEEIDSNSDEVNDGSQ